jgi:hypothetical protein
MNANNVRSKNGIVVAAMLVAAVIVGAPAAVGACYKVVSFLCMTSGSESCSKNCKVNCLCPGKTEINGACHIEFNETCAWTDSTQHSLACDQGDKFDSCRTDGVGLETACSYSKQKIVCPSLLPTPLVCVPTLTYETVGGPRRTVITGNPCGG